MNRQKHLTLAVVILFIMCFVQAASAEPCQTILSNGLPEQKVDIAILGDGYTSAEMEKYKTDAQNFVNALFAQEPFREYRSYFNVHRIDVVSNESGADESARMALIRVPVGAPIPRVPS